MATRDELAKAIANQRFLRKAAIWGAIIDLGQAAVWWLVLENMISHPVVSLLGSIFGACATAVVMFYRGGGRIKQDDPRGPWREAAELGGFMFQLAGASMAIAKAYPVGIDWLVLVAKVFILLNIYPVLGYVVSFTGTESLSEKVKEFDATIEYYSKMKPD